MYNKPFIITLYLYACILTTDIRMQNNCFLQILDFVQNMELNTTCVNLNVFTTKSKMGKKSNIFV